MEPVREARHNLRGKMNALKLCVSAFEFLDDPAELVEFLDMMQHAADRAVEALDALEAAYAEHNPVDIPAER